MSVSDMSFVDICSVMDSFENPILIDRITLEMVGDLATAAVLSRLRYWFSPSKKNGQLRTKIIKNSKTWVARTKEEWWEECGVTEKQIERIAKKLQSMKLVEVKYFRFNGLRTSHWNLNLEEYTKQFNLASKKFYGTPQKGSSVSPKGADRKAPKGPTHNTLLKHSSYTSSLNTTPTPPKKRSRFQTSCVQVALLKNGEFHECFESQQKAYLWLRNFEFDENTACDLVENHFNDLLPSVEYLKYLFDKDKKPIECISGYLLQIVKKRLYLKYK